MKQQASVNAATDPEPCPPPWCTGNSPVIDKFGLWELNLDHEQNRQGFTLLGMSRSDPAGSTEWFDLDVQDSALVALDRRRNVRIRGKGLEGFTIWLSRGKLSGVLDHASLAQYGLRISEFHTVPEAVKRPRRKDDLATYLLEWRPVSARKLTHVINVAREPQVSLEEPGFDPSIPPMPACPDTTPWDVADPRDIDAPWDESAPMGRFNAVVFEGDRVDATTRTVKPTAENRWFNIGCARHTLAKMRLTRNTINTVASGDWRDVQAVLKMLSADYCGNGLAFTVAGTPLLWQQTGPAMMTYHARPQPGSLEARWNENGATCIATPRLDVHPDPSFHIPNIARYLERVCRLDRIGAPGERAGPRRCDDTDPRPSGRERITSANH